MSVAKLVTLFSGNPGTTIWEIEQYEAGAR
jgi:hypothetical protein